MLTAKRAAKGLLFYICSNMLFAAIRTAAFAVTGIQVAN